MALANVANLLAANGSRVLVVDFDLEAPGLSSYEPFLGSGSDRGIVDFVQEYLSVDAAPDASQFIHERTWHDRKFWIMPAGRHRDGDYGSILASIDWDDLYQNHQGFLLFEDLKRQWKSMRFDYVLIDSRTGYSDVSGICTRQLPDAVVAMFVPTRQNLEGLAPVLAAIKAEGPPVVSGRIHTLICPSNVPSADNQEVELERLLDKCRRALETKKFAGLINHSDSLELLEQGIVTHDQPTAKLSRQYEELFRSIVALNLDDKRGAIEMLDSAASTFDEARRNNDASALDALEKRFLRIRRLHPEDPEVAWKSARLANLMLLRNEELASLNTAIRHGYEEVRSRTRRASMLAGNGDREGALADLDWLFKEAKLTAFEALPALELLRNLRSDGWLDAVAGSLASGRPQPSAAAALLQYSLTSRRVVPVLIKAAEQYIESNSEKDDSDRLNNSLVLLYISNQSFDEALRLLGSHEALMTSTKVSDVFNAAIAEWGANGYPPLDLFRRTLLLLNPKTEGGDANLRQCIALCNAVIGKEDIALKELDAADARARAERGSFSCWTYLHLEPASMAVDLDDMRASILRGEFTPAIVRRT